MKTCLLSGNFALDTIVTRNYPNGFIVGKSNKFTETKVASVPNDNVVDWEGAGDWTTSQFIACLCERDILSISQMTTDSVRECLEIACTTASRSVSHLGSKGLIDVKNLPTLC